MESNTWCPRLTAWIILSGSAVHVKGFGSALCSTTKRLIAACKSMTDRKMPRFNRRFVSLAKKPSTALSQDADVGVKWKVQRGCRAKFRFACARLACSSRGIPLPDSNVRRNPLEHIFYTKTKFTIQKKGSCRIILINYFKLH